MPDMSYFAMKLACWSIIREVGAFAGITASFTITAIVVWNSEMPMVQHRKKNLFNFYCMSFQNRRCLLQRLLEHFQCWVGLIIQPETSLSFHMSRSSAPISPVAALNIIVFNITLIKKLLWVIAFSSATLAPVLRVSKSYFPTSALPSSAQHSACS